MQSLDLSVNKHINIDSTKFDVDFISAWDFFEDFGRESRNCIDVNLSQIKFVQQSAFMDVERNRFVIQHVIAEERNKGRHDVLDRSSIQIQTESTWNWRIIHLIWIEYCGYDSECSE